MKHGYSCGHCFAKQRSFLSLTAKFLPERLTLTVSKDQDLDLTLRKRQQSNSVQWQKEPVLENSWKTAEVVDDRVVIPASQVEGPGFYTLAPAAAAKQLFGTFHLAVQGE